MGMRTELIFGASLKRETPPHVIETLKYLLYKTDEKPTPFPFTEGEYRMVLTNSSYSFGVSESVGEMWFDDVTNAWHISTGSNVKEGASLYKTFLEWIKPYIEHGSSFRDMYAITICEDDDEPTIHYLEEKTY